TNVVTDGCSDHSPADPAVGPTVDDLATALAELAPFEVSSPPTDVSVFGYQGKYVQLTVPDTPVASEGFTDCVGGKIRSWINRYNPAAFYGYNGEPGRIEEFWILDVDGTRLVIETNWSPASPEADVAEMRTIFDSIRIQPSSGVDVSASSVVPATTVLPRDMGELFADGGFPPVEPGAYVIDPDGDASTPLTVAYDVPAGWSAWPGAVKFYDPDPTAVLAGHVMLSITTVTNVVTDGCSDHSPADPAVGPTVDDLATALAELAPFEVSSPPTDVTVFGYQGKYVQLTVPDTPVAGESFTDCVGGKIRSWIDRHNPAAFFGYNAEPGRTEEFWILDVDGTRLVIETNWSPASPEFDVAEMRSIFDSIRIQP
ncbi:MAG TPA: hypothetical protein VES40_04215, partial [Ilumatobacteraceae bacterium]|nr:hypothetical protein [Ilumatobacteraceae bacterium]